MLTSRRQSKTRWPEVTPSPLPPLAEPPFARATVNSWCEGQNSSWLLVTTLALWLVSTLNARVGNWRSRRLFDHIVADRSASFPCQVQNSVILPLRVPLPRSPGVRLVIPAGHEQACYACDPWP